MMRGAGESPTPAFNTITLRDDRQSPEALAAMQARYPILDELVASHGAASSAYWANTLALTSQTFAAMPTGT